ncbi:hypothetical protein ALC57_09098 [Trachymyrmex cornetzi]|uniref:Myb/SANT-like DNA-binding domain-containing protein n=1 Tax=Trachymyrmex cornetzi TaxID=471704 RepID=A0A151J5S8_9HYME|nr:hypothetical protein ALC57_09098 [Trachymyrmex cornetzi]
MKLIFPVILRVLLLTIQKSLLIYLNHHLEKHSMGNKENNQNESTPVSFLWNDATTKLFLDVYKRKKDLVNTRKIKTYKHSWKNIAEDMLHSGYSVTPLQVENKFKSLTRSYKNMVSNNKKTGRARTTCKYETELSKLFGKKHNIYHLLYQEWISAQRK